MVFRNPQKIEYKSIVHRKTCDGTVACSKYSFYSIFLYLIEASIRYYTKLCSDRQPQVSKEILQIGQRPDRWCGQCALLHLILLYHVTIFSSVFWWLVNRPRRHHTLPGIIVAPMADKVRPEHIALDAIPVIRFQPWGGDSLPESFMWADKCEFASIPLIWPAVRAPTQTVAIHCPQVLGNDHFPLHTNNGRHSDKDMLYLCLGTK